MTNLGKESQKDCLQKNGEDAYSKCDGPGRVGVIFFDGPTLPLSGAGRVWQTARGEAREKKQGDEGKVRKRTRSVSPSILPGWKILGGDIRKNLRDYRWRSLNNNKLALQNNLLSTVGTQTGSYNWKHHAWAPVKKLKGRKVSDSGLHY